MYIICNWTPQLTLTKIHPERYHDDVSEQPLNKQTSLSSDTSTDNQQKQSKLDKVKQTLNLNK